jgi:CRISPR-associated protein Csm4
MNWYIVRLRFNGALHVGRDDAGVGIEGVQPYTHSDTLFSAFCNVWSGDEAGEKAIEAAKEGNPPIRLSSAFPYYADKKNPNKFIYFLPRPLLPVSTSFNVYARTVKQTSFLSLDQFEGWARGDIIDDVGAEHHRLGYANHSELYIEQVRPRHASSRITMTSAIYHCGEIFFRDGAGLYFLAETSDLDLLQNSLNRLSHSGLGGERSIGYGSFKYDIPELITEGSRFGKLRSISGNASCLLSIYYPDKGEIAEIQSLALAYGTVLRKGWFYSKSAKEQGKRKTCRMFSEGSIFRSLPKGRILDVRPHGMKHQVFRYGMAMSLPIKISGANYA